jgi:hypothetical protein
MDEGTPADDAPAVLATGRGDVRLAVVSMSAAEPDGRDDDYVRWHLLDHLPEQFRLPGFRWGRRWRSTGRGRAHRLAEVPPYDRVDHVVGYLFAEPLDEAIDGFFALGRALHEAGRMPIRLPSVQLAAWKPVERRAASRIKAGADVVPFRPDRGVVLLIEQGDPGATLDSLVATDGVAGAWRFRGTDGRHAGFAPTADLALTIIYVDDDPVEVVQRLGAAVDRESERLLLAAPFDPATVGW